MSMNRVSDRKDQEMTDYDTEDDSSSIASYTTAPEDSDHDENNIQTDNEGTAWSHMIQKYGAKPFALVDTEKETFDLLISSIGSVRPIVAGQKKIEEFSGAKLTFHKCPKQFALGLRITGTVVEADLAIKACNALIEDRQVENGMTVWVTLKLEGPHFLSSVAAIREKLGHLLPQAKFTTDDALHITTACVQITDRNELENLLDRLTHIARLLSQAYEADPTMVGHLGRLSSCSSQFLSISPKASNDPLNTIVYTIRQLLQNEYGFHLMRNSKPHMTIFSSLKYLEDPFYVDKAPYFNRLSFDNLGISADLGKVLVTAIQVSRRVPLLGGSRFDTIALFPINSTLSAL